MHLKSTKMKFAGLMLVAIAVASVHAGNPSTQKALPTESSSGSGSASVDSSESCNFACLAVMQPVTDENGVTYSNECMMRAAKCKSKKKDVGVSGDSNEKQAASRKASGDARPKAYCPNILCPAVYSPVYDDNGKIYPNKCSMEVAKCNGPRENVLDEYKRIYGKSFGDGDTNNDLDKTEKSKKVLPSSKCASGCPDVEMPVCGSDGVWYSNPCELKTAACKNPEQNIVEDEAACSSKATGDETTAKMSQTIDTMTI